MLHPKVPASTQFRHSVAPYCIFYRSTLYNAEIVLMLELERPPVCIALREGENVLALFSTGRPLCNCNTKHLPEFEARSEQGRLPRLVSNHLGTKHARFLLFWNKICLVWSTVL